MAASHPMSLRSPTSIPRAVFMSLAQTDRCYEGAGRAAVESDRLPGIRLQLSVCVSIAATSLAFAAAWLFIPGCTVTSLALAHSFTMTSALEVSAGILHFAADLLYEPAKNGADSCSPAVLWMIEVLHNFGLRRCPPPAPPLLQYLPFCIGSKTD